MHTTRSAILLASGMAVAAPAAVADTYVIDPTHTFAYWEVNHLGLSNFTGRFDRTEGSVRFDPDAQTGHVEIVIHVDSVSSGVDKLDEHLLSDDFFHVEAHPTMRFVSNNFHFDGKRVIAVDGELTLLGTTQPVQLQFTNFNCLEHPMRRVQACGGNAVAHIQRSHFGMDSLIPAISDAVRLSIEVEALREEENATNGSGEDNDD